MMSSETIMVVDDEMGALTLIEVVLEKNGFKVETATGSMAALDRIESLTPDLFVLDIMMPDMDGIELCRRLRANPMVGQKPVVILSARYDSESIRASHEAGANIYLHKPILPSELVTAVRTLLH
jgi:DNA-binding response OmpR family regulator